MTNGSHTTALKSVKKKGRLSICAVSEAHMIWKKQNCRWMKDKTNLHENQIYDTILYLYYTVTLLGKGAENCKNKILITHESVKKVTTIHY